MISERVRQMICEVELISMVSQVHAHHSSETIAAVDNL